MQQGSSFRITNPEYLPALTFLLVAIGFITLTYPYLKAAYFAMILTYLLVSPHRALMRLGCSQLAATALLMLLITSLLLIVLFVFLPMLSNEMVLLIKSIPHYLNVLNTRLTEWLANHPKWQSNLSYEMMLKPIQNNLALFGKHVLEVSFTSLFSVFNWMIYCILVPILTGLILQDRDTMMPWLTQWLPEQHSCLKTFFKEIDAQMGYYLRGKVIEFLLVSILTTLGLSVMGLNYALLMGLLVGLSVFIPIVGLFIVIIPIVFIGLTQWGLAAHFGYTMILFTVIMLLDAYLIVPMLFAGRMALHPAVILIAILCFGGLFGFWGILLALPLATVVRSLLHMTRTSITF